MSELNQMILKQMNWRYATKKFDPSRKISEADWKTLVEATLLAPSSYGLQPWKIIVPQDPALRKRLREASWGQSQIEDASHLAVFATLKKMSQAHVDKFFARISEVRGAPPAQLEGFRNVVLNDVVHGPRNAVSETWNQRQAYIALGTLLTTAALLEIDACPMEGIEPAKYDELLGLKGGEYSAVAVVALGYRSSDDPMQHLKKVRFATKDVVQVIG